MIMRDYVAAEKRIAAVFGSEKAPEVGNESLQVYRTHLLHHLNKAAVLTGREDFLWEEFYVFGPGDKKEYEELKKNRASYTDAFELVDIPKKTIGEHDLIARVKRLSDKQIFEIGLSWLTTNNSKTETHQLLDDFATWIVNYQ